MTDAINASSVSVSESQAPLPLLVAARTAANRVRIIVWSRICDDVGLTNQVYTLKTRSGIQKSRQAVRLPFQSTFKF